MRGLTLEARSGYRKACGDIAVELQHAINHDEQTRIISNECNRENIEKFKKVVNRLIRVEGKVGRHTTYSEEGNNATEIL